MTEHMPAGAQTGTITTIKAVPGTGTSAADARRARLTTLTATVSKIAAELDAVRAELGAITAAPWEPQPVVTPSLLAVDQAAERLGLSRSAVYLLITDGTLRSIQIGSRRRVPAVAVDEYVDRLVSGAA